MTILCVSGSRADYGYLRPIAQALGVDVADFAAMTQGRDTAVSIGIRAGTFGNVVAERIAHDKPRLMVVVGDRWEILSACQAAVLAGVPIAHIAAGECTAAAYDDKFRGAIEALADLHIAISERGYARLMDEGKTPVLAGCTSVAPPAEIAQGNGTAIVALYPETAGEPLVGVVDMICTALNARGLTPYVIGANPDVGSHDYPGISLPLDDFHARLAAANLIIGNSSAGIIEAPILGTPTVNIGRRQEGRPKAASVFQVSTNAYLVPLAIEAALKFGKQRVESPYYRADAVQVIVKAISKYMEVHK